MRPFSDPQHGNAVNPIVFPGARGPGAPAGCRRMRHRWVAATLPTEPTDVSPRRSGRAVPQKFRSEETRHGTWLVKLAHWFPSPRHGACRSTRSDVPGARQYRPMTRGLKSCLQNSLNQAGHDALLAVEWNMSHSFLAAMRSGKVPLGGRRGGAGAETLRRASGPISSETSRNGPASLPWTAETWT